jgi:hypothetical protein
MKKIIDFVNLYQLYRIKHGRKYAARAAARIAFGSLPF